MSQLKAILMAGCDSPWIPHNQPGHTPPHPKQLEFMLSEEKEVFFGGAAGGGKSEALLMSALMFVEWPAYSAIIFRRTFRELSMRGGLLQRSHEWLANTAAKFNGDNHTWTFPSGATLSFGHMEHLVDVYKYKSSEFTFIGYDELTSFILPTSVINSGDSRGGTENQYLYLFSRLRKNVDNPLPLRMRSASNPGDIGHDFVKQRFVDPHDDTDRRFIPSLLKDNPSLSREDYEKSLGHLDPLTRRQLMDGLWINIQGLHFIPNRWPRFSDQGDAYLLGQRPNQNRVLKRDVTFLVAVDWATSEKKTSDCTAMLAGGLMPDGEIILLEATNERIRSEFGAMRLNDFYTRWPGIIGFDDDLLSKTMRLECQRWMLPEIWLLPIQSRAKIVRAKQAIIMGENRRIYLPEGGVYAYNGKLVEPDWITKFCDQLASFVGINKPEEDDLVDALSNMARMAQSLRNPMHPDRMEEPTLLIPGKENW